MNEARRVVVSIEDADSGARDRQVFGWSPVRIGTAPTSDLLLRCQVGVAAEHGEVAFGMGFTQFRDAGSEHGTWIDGQRIDPGTVVALTPLSVVTIGRFRMEIDVETSQGECDVVRALIAGGESAIWPRFPTPALASVCAEAVAAKAVDVIAAMALALIRLRRHMPVLPGIHLAELRSIRQIVDYLLDPRGPDSRLDELGCVLDELIGLTTALLVPTETRQH